MKKSNLIFSALLLCSAAMAQPKGLVEDRKELFTRRVNFNEWTKKIGVQKWSFIAPANAFGRLLTLKEAKKILIEYDKCIELPDYDSSVGLDSVLCIELTKIVSLIALEGYVIDYFFILGDYGISVYMSASISAMKVEALTKKEIKLHQENLAAEN